MPVTTSANDAAAKAAEKLVNGRIDGRLISVEGEADRLWNHVLFGTGTCVGMIEGYVQLKMPGNPLSQLHALVERLVQVIQTLERK